MLRVAIDPGVPRVICLNHATVADGGDNLVGPRISPAESDMIIKSIVEGREKWAKSRETRFADGALLTEAFTRSPRHQQNREKSGSGRV